MKKIALFGGSFNPPGEHHRAIANAVSAYVDEIIVVPCGPRPDKPIPNDVEPIYRAAMVEMTFRGLPKVQVELFDLENNTFTRTHELDTRYREVGEVWHIIGTDLIQGGSKGHSPIQKSWVRGTELWKNGRFIVVKRPGIPFEPADLPPKNLVIEAARKGASSDIRQAVFHSQAIHELVTPEVSAYIERYGLYRGRPADRTTHLRLKELRPLLVADEQNPEAAAFAKRLGLASTTGQPNLIVVVGGDGAMLHAIRKYWRLRLPFYGINLGHMGFLLNDRNSPPERERDLSVYLLPLLWVEVETTTGEKHTSLAFNDAWVERATGQAAWIRILVNGKERMSRLVGDNALVATAAGSASYARAMGAHPLPCNTPALLLVASNVLRPSGWKGAVLTLDNEVEFIALDPIKRPLAGFMDGKPLGNIVNMKVRVSKTASVELMFDPEFDPSEKLAKIQFPSFLE